VIVENEQINAGNNIVPVRIEGRDLLGLFFFSRWCVKAFARFGLLEQRSALNGDELQETLVERASKVILANRTDGLFIAGWDRRSF
jgi:hypothetical protein